MLARARQCAASPPTNMRLLIAFASDNRIGARPTRCAHVRTHARAAGREGPSSKGNRTDRRADRRGRRKGEGGTAAHQRSPKPGTLVRASQAETGGPGAASCGPPDLVSQPRAFLCAEWLPNRSARHLPSGGHPAGSWVSGGSQTAGVALRRAAAQAQARARARAAARAVRHCLSR